MRIFVLADEGAGNVKLLESRHVFKVSDVRLAYTCPSCRHEFVFGEDASDPIQRFKQCPMCGEYLKTVGSEANPDVGLWEALSKYREFRKYVADHGLPLSFMIREVTPAPTKGE